LTASAVLANPARISGQLALRPQLLQQLRRAGWSEPAWIETDPAGGERAQLDRALGAGVDVLFACGGDGTVASAVQALARHPEVALAVVPLGSGNLLARNLALPLDPLAAIRVALAGARRRIDLGEVGDVRFCVAAGMGLDAQMLADAPRLAKRVLGWLAYVPSFVRHLPEPGFTVEITVDGGPPILRRVRSVLIANVGTLPGGLRLLPTALADDGQLDVILIASRRLRDWARISLRVGLRHPGGMGLESFVGRRVEIVTDVPRPCEADGEPLPPASALVVRVLPGALLVCTSPP
jgi:diacylglycerol kinase family enzyme